MSVLRLLPLVLPPPHTRNDNTIDDSPPSCIRSAHPRTPVHLTIPLHSFRAVQLPVFITTVWAIRRMSVSGWPGLSEGGALWFPDLTLPALDVANLAAPLGSVGIALPVAVSAAMFANVTLAFGPLDAISVTRKGVLMQELAGESLNVRVRITSRRMCDDQGDKVVYWLEIGFNSHYGRISRSSIL